jgi:hypothetical protein
VHVLQDVPDGLVVCPDIQWQKRIQIHAVSSQCLSKTVPDWRNIPRLSCTSLM